MISDVTSSSSIDRVKDLLDEYLSLSSLYEKLKFLCRLNESQEVTESFLNNVTEKHFLEYYTILGPDRIKACGYNITLLNRELGIRSFDKQALTESIYEHFIVGERYSSADIKSTLSTFYEDCSFDKTAVATDLQDWFNVQDVTMTVKTESGDTKRTRGYRILSKK